LGNLRRLRKERKMTLSELARQVGVTEVCLCRYENGKRKMPVEMAKKIADVLGCEWHVLYDE